jgi:transposase
VADIGRIRVRSTAARADAVMRIDVAWIAVEPLDMRSGVDIALARVVNVFGAAHSHHAYLFLNRRSNRLKVLVRDGFGLWLRARRLQQGHFVRLDTHLGTRIELTSEQLRALVVGLPWQRLLENARISVL